MSFRNLVDPKGHGVPRRAVISPETGLVSDKTLAPHLPEVDVLSEICHVVFDTEPRNPNELLKRALDDDITSAWTALRDDLLLGHVFTVSPDKLAKYFLHGDELRVYVCSLLFSGKIDVTQIVPRICAFSDDTLAAFQRVVIKTDPPANIVADLLSKHPRSSKIFLKYPRIIDLPAYCPDIGLKLCEYAASIQVHSRYPALAMASLVGRAGAKISTKVAVDTLVKIQRTRFDIRLAASAASVASLSDDATIKGLASVIESLAAHVQTTLGSSSLSN